MFKVKFIISASLFILFLLITSAIKNNTRVIEKNISRLNAKIFTKEKNINEAQLDFFYLTSPKEIEKKLTIIGFDNYQPIKHSNIFYDAHDFNALEKKLSNLINIDEKKKRKK